MEKIKENLIKKSNERCVNGISNKFKDYNDYIYYQTIQGLSFESDNLHWANGQKQCIEKNFCSLDRKLKILDVCCGDGAGLSKLKEMGFKNVLGIEICDKKIEIAKKFYKIKKMDICCGPFDFDTKFDVIYSSHTIEHVLDPLYTISNLMKYLNTNGKFIMILPYPELIGGNPNNDHNYKIHCGVIPLGLNIKDEGKTICNIINNLGFRVSNIEFHDYREPEIHLIIEH